MEFTKNDKVVNVKTGEFAVFQFMQEVVTASGATVPLYEVFLDKEGSPRLAWTADEIAHWAKAPKTGLTMISAPPKTT